MITKISNLKKNTLYGSKIINFEMPIERSLDIDTYDDLKKASISIKKLINENKIIRGGNV